MGADADIVIFDPNEKHVISVDNQHMRVDYSAYEGVEVTGKVKFVLSRGRVIVESGEYMGNPRRPVPASRHQSVSDLGLVGDKGGPCGRCGSGEPGECGERHVDPGVNRNRDPDRPGLDTKPDQECPGGGGGDHGDCHVDDTGQAASVDSMSLIEPGANVPEPEQEGASP